MVSRLRERIVPVNFCCDMCNERQYRQLPSSSTYTSCRKCGNLVNLSQMERTSRYSGNSNSLSSSSAFRRNNSTVRRMPMRSEFSEIGELEEYFEDSNDDFYENYEAFMQSPEIDYDFDNYDGHEISSVSNNIRNMNRRQFRTNFNSRRRQQQQQQQQQNQGMFTINIPNDNYNRHSYNARRMNRMHGNYDLDEFMLDDIEEEIENTLNLASVDSSSLAHSFIPELPKIVLPKPKPKIKKISMTKKMFIKNDKGKLEAPTCCICLGVLKVKDNVSRLSCKHLFHYDCLKKWVEVKEECPFCRGKIN